MRSAYAGLALAALAVAKPVPQSSSSCSMNYPGSFKIQVVKTGSKAKRQSNGDEDLVVTLKDGILMDNQGRQGEIVANKQFQFDQPLQAGAIQTNGFQVCGGYLAHSGDVTTWDECLSGDFYNLYSDNSFAAGNPGQCKQINIQVIGSSASAVAATTAPVTQISDGQPQASTAVPAPVTQISDGQIQATTATPVAPVTQITDGQIQAPTSTPVAPVTQISDGQIQAPTSTVAPVTQISDGQVQAPTAAPYPSGTGAAMPSGTGVMPYSTGVVPATGAAATNGPIAGLIAAVGIAAALL